MNIKVTFTTGQTSVSLNSVLNMETSNLELAKRKIRGSILDEIFEYIAAYRALNAKGLKFSKPMQLKFETDFMSFDTSVLSKEFQDTFKLQFNTAGKIRFANRFKIMFNYAIRVSRTITDDQLIAELSAALKSTKTEEKEIGEPCS